MATLTVAVALLLIITVSTLFVSRSQLFDMKTASNHYRHTQAFEMAERGLEQTVAWLQERAAVPDDQNAACTSGQVVPIRKAVWECKAGVPAGDCDTYEYLAVPAAGAVNHCNAGHPDIRNQTLVDATLATVAAFDVEVTIRRKKGLLNELYRFDVISEAKTTDYNSSDDPYKSRALVRQSVALHPMPARRIPPNPGAPILVRDVVTVRTPAKICVQPCINDSGSLVAAGGLAVATLDDDLSGFDAKSLERIRDEGGTVKALSQPGFTVFDILFRGVSPCDMLALSNTQSDTLPLADRTVFVYGSCGGVTSKYAWTSSLPASGFPAGTASKPIVIAVLKRDVSDNDPKTCPSFGSVTVHGLFYFGRDCNANGWGQLQLFGTVGVEGSLLNMSGTPTLNYGAASHTGKDEDQVIKAGNLAPGRLARIPGSWRDF